MSDELKSFKISDQRKPTVSGGRPKEEAPAPSSAGFPHIEALVESPAPDLSGLTARHSQLDELAKAKGTAKEKADAKRAAGAYGKALALIEYLLETKRNMAGGGG